MLAKEEQLMKELFPMLVVAEPSVTLVTLLQPLNVPWLIAVSAVGRTIFVNEEQDLKASTPIAEIDVPDKSRSPEVPVPVDAVGQYVKAEQFWKV